MSRAPAVPPLVALALAAGVVSAPLAAQQHRPLRGQILAAADSAPVEGAVVSVLAAPVTTVTDHLGTFLLQIPAGPAHILVRGVGIAPDTVLVPADVDTVRVYVRKLAIELPPVGVEGQVPERARFDSVAQTSTLTLSARDLIGAPGVLEADVMRVLQLLPGTVARNDYSIGYNVRGGESDQNLVRLDGMTILNPSHLGGLFSTFDVNAVDHADFLTGGFPAQYSGRLSSVLDVSLRNGNHERVHGQAAVSMLSAKLLGEGPVGPVSVLLGARRTYIDQVVKAFTPDDLPYAFTDLVGKLDYPYGSRGDLAVTGYWGDDALVLNLISDSTGRTPVDLAFAWGNQLLGVTWRQPVGRMLLEQRLSYTGFTSHLELRPNLVSYHNPASIWSASSTLAFSSRRHEGRVGADFEGYDLRYSIANPAIPNELGFPGNPSPAFFNTRYQPAVLAGFVDDQWRPSQSLLLRGGVRVERVGGGADVTTVAPRAAFKVFVSRDQAITGSLGSYYQVIQSLSDRDLPISIYEFWVGANGKIPVAHSDHVVAGMERWLGAGHATALSIEGYYKTFGNLIRPQPGLALRDTSNVFQPVDGNAWGVEVLLRRYVGRTRGWIAYSFVRAVRHSGGETYPPAHDRTHSLNVVVESPGPLGGDLGVRFGFGSPLPYTALIGSWNHQEYSPTSGTFTGTNAEPLPGPLNGARYAVYSRLDAGCRWHLHRLGIDWQPHIDVVNVTDRQNVFAYFFDTDASPPTRTAFYQLPILVSVGLDLSW
jgi:hypothetical protein